MKNYYVYIVASESWTLYIWVTNNLERRIYEHKEWSIEWFTKKYWCKKLLYFEECNDIIIAISREKQLKKWNRKKKEWLIGLKNPSRKDLSLEWI
ncbi:MAG: Excinuclease ABC C subunit protein [uncultured bacterium (gcode 4)]|uniref:Excinuclease ABC C subunit protein n=1 Tax=uncultured bacterium (gcode 4) TaxID=1234023 RepID=K1XHT2_9BACT|nr:MAG: Excinuclease ABC C subunit protein [uncultured bacterium (gcode 4)]